MAVVQESGPEGQVIALVDPTDQTLLNVSFIRKCDLITGPLASIPQLTPFQVYFATDTEQTFIGLPTGNVPMAPAVGSGGLSVIPATKMLYVDQKRTDSYTATGSVSQPFKTIMAAVNQIVANGDNGPSVPYEVCVASGVYGESIDLSNSKLTNVSFVGRYGTIVGIPYGGSSTLPAPLINVVNNDNLLCAIFVGLNFVSGAIGPHGMVFSSTTNNTLFGSGNISGTGGIQFFDCVISTPDFYVNNCGLVAFNNCILATAMNVTNCITFFVGPSCQYPQGGQLNVFTTATPAPSGFVACQAQLQAVVSLASMSIDAQSSIVAYVSRLRGPATVNGLLTNRGSSISGAITVNSGGTYKEDTGGGHSGALTLNGTGAYTQTGTVGVGALKINGVSFTAGSGSPNGVVMGSPGDAYLSTTGGALTTLWVKETGVNTNTGWIGK